jgi:hypothetical protein
MNFSSFRLVNRTISRRLSVMVLRPKVLDPFARGPGYCLSHALCRALAFYHFVDELSGNVELPRDIDLFRARIQEGFFYFDFGG